MNTAYPSGNQPPTLPALRALVQCIWHCLWTKRVHLFFVVLKLSSHFDAYRLKIGQYSFKGSCGLGKQNKSERMLQWQVYFLIHGNIMKGACSWTLNLTTLKREIKKINNTVQGCPKWQTWEVMDPRTTEKGWKMYTFIDQNKNMEDLSLTLLSLPPTNVCCNLCPTVCEVVISRSFMYELDRETAPSLQKIKAIPELRKTQENGSWV